MCSKHRLEDVTAMNNEGDEVIVKGFVAQTYL